MNGALLDRYLLCNDTLPESKQYDNNNEDSNIIAQNKDQEKSKYPTSGTGRTGWGWIITEEVTNGTTSMMDNDDGEPKEEGITKHSMDGSSNLPKNRGTGLTAIIELCIKSLVPERPSFLKHHHFALESVHHCQHLDHDISCMRGEVMGECDTLP
jgi:hypothetical protein